MDDATLYDLFGSLSREISSVKEELKAEFKEELKGEFKEVKGGVQRIEARLARQGGIINGGTRQVARLITWSEEIDTMMAERDLRIEDLSRRIAKLEGKG